MFVKKIDPTASIGVQLTSADVVNLAGMKRLRTYDIKTATAAIIESTILDLSVYRQMRVRASRMRTDNTSSTGLFLTLFTDGSELTSDYFGQGSVFNTTSAAYGSDSSASQWRPAPWGGYLNKNAPIHYDIIIGIDPVAGSPYYSTVMTGEQYSYSHGMTGGYINVNKLSAKTLGFKMTASGYNFEAGFVEIFGAPK